MGAIEDGTLLLARREVEELLAPAACIDAVEDAFRRLAMGEVPAPAILAMHTAEGGFHVKAGILARERPYFAAKVNANFPHNGARFGLPTIQGAVLLFDAVDGRLLAIMDSMAITALRTAAASAVAAKYLARPSSRSVLVCGCGGQALEQLRALACVVKPAQVRAYDIGAQKAKAFAARAEKALDIPVEVATDVAAAARSSDIIVTCTTAKRFFISRDMVRPGVFIAAVGADNEDKQEIEPALLAASKVVTDVTEQALRIGDLHHAALAGVMGAHDVHAELGDVVAGRKAGREDDEEITIFDSTGTGLQDVAAAIAVYRRAMAGGGGTRHSFS
jgi:alanine dehydrogenase